MAEDKNKDKKNRKGILRSKRNKNANNKPAGESPDNIPGNLPENRAEVKPSVIPKENKDSASKGTASLNNVVNTPKDDFTLEEQKDFLDPVINGLNFDEAGDKVTPQTQLMNAVVKKDDPSDDRPLNQVADEINRAGEFKNVLSDEQEKAKSLTDLFDKNPSVTDTQIPSMTVDDIASVTELLIDDLETGDLNTENKFREMLSSLGSTPINYGQPALEKLGLTDYYPDINTPIQVGNYTGSIIGNNPIFAAGGGYAPRGIYDARKRAMERAAKARVAQGDKIKNLMLVDAAPQYLDKFHDKGLDIFDKWGEKVKWDYNKLTDMSNPEAREFQKEYQNYFSTAKRSLDLNKRFESVMDAYNVQGKFIPPGQLEDMYSWRDGSVNIDDLVDNPKLLNKIEKSFQYYDNLADDAEALTTKIQKEKTLFGRIPETEQDFEDLNAELDLIQSGKGYDIYRSGELKWVDGERIANLVDTKVKNNNYFGKNAKDEMAQYVNNLISSELSAKYLEANKKSTSFNNTVNMPGDVTQSNEVRLLSQIPAWNQNLPSLMAVGDEKSIMNNMNNVLGLEPIKDKNGNFKDGIIAGKFSLGKGETEKGYYPAAALFFIGNDGVERDLEGYQVSLMEGIGMNEGQIAAAFKMKKGIIGDQGKIYDALLESGVFGSKTSPQGAAISYWMSIDSNSQIGTTWSERTYTQKWEDEDGDLHDLRVSEPGKAVESKPYISFGGGVVNPYDPDDSKFANLSFRIGYSLNNTVGGLPSADSYVTGQSAQMKKEAKQGNKSSTRTFGGSAATGVYNVK